MSSGRKPSVSPMSVFAVALYAGAMLSGAGAKPSSSPAPLVLRHVHVVDVRAGVLLDDQTVVVEGGRIAAVGKAGSVSAPPGAKTVDAGANYLIPGLWDMHVHAAWKGVDEVFAPLFVANGVTGVREMFGSMDVVRAWKARSESGDPWPRMIGAGHILDGPKPFWPGSTVAAT